MNGNSSVDYSSVDYSTSGTDKINQSAIDKKPHKTDVTQQKGSEDNSSKQTESDLEWEHIARTSYVLNSTHLTTLHKANPKSQTLSKKLPEVTKKQVHFGKNTKLVF